MKRLVVCCDGTWKEFDALYPTNVVKIAQAVTPLAQDGVVQETFYDAGVGTRGKLDGLIGGVFGRGLDQNIQDAYRFLCLNYSLGDEIYLFGFSRGAYTVRSLAGMIYTSGLLTASNICWATTAYELYREDIPPNHPKMVEFRHRHGVLSELDHGRVPITLLGCWDTVGALGLPEMNPLQKLSQRYNQRYQFHDTFLSPMIRHALHAVAVDEPRQIYEVTPMNPCHDVSDQRLRQVWFPGDHISVGGGSESMQGLSDNSLKWMIESMGQWHLGLDLDLTLIPNGLHPNPIVDFAEPSMMTHLTRLAGTRLRTVSDRFEDLDISVVRRWQQRQDYRPQNLLEKHGQRLDEA